MCGVETLRPVAWARGNGVRASQRATILRTLAEVCGRLARLQRDEDVKRACRELAAELRAWGRAEEGRGKEKEGDR
jgi:hypothetical protein